ncbi:MAG: mevalonate kinase [Candidatus Levybacteria bacterium]|nr:mevalonate kinase [Candidatus Levybacteria bacterium]
MKKITVSAPGKLMLFGEHAVVYGHPCIVTAVDQRMFVTVEKNSSGMFVLNAPEVEVSNYTKPIENLGVGQIPKGAKFIEIALGNLISKYNLKPAGLKVITRSEFSSKFGFGSSSASTVCLVKAISELFSLKLSQRQIFDISYKTVLDVQGKGSGFDVAAAIYGGTIYFKKFGSEIVPLKISDLNLIVGYSGIKADTVSLIDSVTKRFKGLEELKDEMLKAIGKIVDDARVALENQDFAKLGSLMNINQGLLEALGVSIEKLDNMNSASVASGAYGAKLSGAGGGDCMIALSSKEMRKKVENAIVSVGGKILSVKTNAQGVRIEK